MEEAISVEKMETQQENKGTSFLRTCFNGINALSGVGILSIPYALSKGGWLSIILLFSVALLCLYTGILLRRCMDSDPLIKAYPDIAHVAFGRKGRALVSTFMYLELFLVAVEFLILEGDNLQKLFPKASFPNIGTLKIGEKQGFVLLTALVVLPTTWLRSLGVMAYVSAGGVLASLILVLSVFWDALQQKISLPLIKFLLLYIYRNAAAISNLPMSAAAGIRTRVACVQGFHGRGEVWNWGGMPTAISLFAFCYCGHAVFPTLCNSMKDRSQFPKVLVVCFALSTICYGSMAVLGYAMYGENLTSQVTLNLPIRNISSKIAIYTTLINPITKYAIIVSPIATALEETFPFRDSRVISYLIRTVLVLSTVIVALTVPFFGYVMAFTGSFLSTSVSMLLPCLCYLKINKASRKLGAELLLILMILVVGTVAAVVGTYTSLRDIFNQVQPK